MYTSSIGIVLCKLGAVYLFVTAAGNSAWIVPRAFDTSGDALAFAVGFLFAIGAPVVGGLLLWKYSNRIATVKDDGRATSDSTPLSQDQLIEAGVILIGLYAVFFGVVSAFSVETADWTFRMSIDADTAFYNDTLIRNWSRRIAYIVQIALGGGLIYGRRGLTALFRKARRLGVDTSQ